MFLKLLLLNTVSGHPCVPLMSSCPLSPSEEIFVCLLSQQRCIVRMEIQLVQYSLACYFSSVTTVDSGEGPL